MKGLDRASLEHTLSRRARHLDLASLMAALDRLGYQPDDIVFRGNPEPDPPRGIVESVKFLPSPGGVSVTLNLGLGGTHGLLPEYFLEVAEDLPEPEQMYGFLAFFESGLLRSYAHALVPERHPRWLRLRDAHFQMLGLGSVSTLSWLFQHIFPELEVRVTRSRVPVRTTSHALVLGESLLDGSSVLGASHDVGRAGFNIEIFAEDELNSSGESWWQIARDRVRAQVLPLLRGEEILLHVQLIVEDHASWASVAQETQLGYDRIEGTPDRHRVWVYRDDTSHA